MYKYDNAFISLQITRKHFFTNKIYQLFLFNEQIVMTENTNKIPKYVISLNLTTTINWIVENSKITAFSFFYKGQNKPFFSPNLAILKEMIAGKVFFTQIADFYEIQMLIGSGMSGEVYRCISTQGEYCAVKKCQKKKLASLEGGISQFIYELSLLQQLQHPNILKLKEVFSDDDFYYIVTEFIDGRTLHNELEFRIYGLTIQEAIKITIQIVDALIYIQDKGIMHRDINPHNIMKSNDQIKLIDFGLARKIKNQLIFPTSGTPGYMAPEIINFTKPYDEKADIFSLGCILYKLLTGENLFHKQKNIYQENKEGQYELRKCSNHPELNSSKMEQLFILLPYMLERDPQNRISAKICKVILMEIENNNSEIEKLIKKLTFYKKFQLSVEEHHSANKTIKSFSSHGHRNKQSLDFIKNDDSTRISHKKQQQTLSHIDQSVITLKK